MNNAVQARARRAAQPQPAARAPAAQLDSLPAPLPDKVGGKAGGRRLQVRKSGVHGRGVFALQAIAAGSMVIEYLGQVISWKEAIRRHPHDPSQPDHTFYFHLDDERVIDGLVGGNSSRWINHSCAPNIEADDSGGRVFLLALHDIMPGEELFFDYGLVIDERLTPALKKRFECRCGAGNCRGTMLAPRRSSARQAKA